MDEDCVLAVRSGIATDQDDTLGFVIDLDYFTERPFGVDRGETLMELLRYFSDGMTNFFHWAIVDDFKGTLAPHPRHGSRT
jgi:hypothetical protein